MILLFIGGVIGRPSLFGGGQYGLYARFGHLVGPALELVQK